MQMKTPYVTDDHVGFFALQLKHVYKSEMRDVNEFEYVSLLIIITLLVACARSQWKTASISLFAGPLVLAIELNARRFID